MENGSYISGDRRPQVGVAVFLLKSSSILLGRRLSPVGYGTFALPGGRLEFGESFEECARREVKEETGMDVGRVDVLTVVNMVAQDIPEPTHFVTLIVRAELVDLDQTPVNLELDKCSGWAWYEWTELPKPLFAPLEDLLKGGFNPFSASCLM
ncbi:nudix hydrolase 1 [Phalaenopsis equestris]|uniref:nudix hydrolase 1 n=1 Tax=Phalaenopsis equestris TaxID=78828 RepID=UPI0009E35DA9|nr:nudix hydrolase 1 [Phalaenopsis equestris]